MKLLVLSALIALAFATTAVFAKGKLVGEQHMTGAYGKVALLCTYQHNRTGSYYQKGVSTGSCPSVDW